MYRFYVFVVIIVIIISGLSCSRSQKISDPETEDGSLTLIAEHKISVIEPSGLFYSRPSGTLFMISDSFNDIYEMSSEGKILRSIPIEASD
ncbi:MAG: SdiA-regulated domain-containing protein, partial [Syntrophothermus sp.]